MSSAATTQVTTMVLTDERRARMLKEPRPRSLPMAPHAAPPQRRLPLAAASRDIDRHCRPIYAVWEITLECDLSCRHCGSRAGHARPDELSTERCLDLVRQMHELGVLEVTLIGGEAYLRDDWTEIAGAIAARGMTVSVTTGGRGMTRARARAAEAAGLKSVSVSIDGLEATHGQISRSEASRTSTRTATTARSRCSARVSASASFSASAHRVRRSITVRSTSSSRNSITRKVSV